MGFGEEGNNLSLKRFFSLPQVPLTFCRICGIIRFWSFSAQLVCRAGIHRVFGSLPVTLSGLWRWFRLRGRWLLLHCGMLHGLWLPVNRGLFFRLPEPYLLYHLKLLPSFRTWRGLPALRWVILCWNSTTPHRIPAGWKVFRFYWQFFTYML